MWSYKSYPAATSEAIVESAPHRRSLLDTFVARSDQRRANLGLNVWPAPKSGGHYYLEGRFAADAEVALSMIFARVFL
jgi:hypothetical protein